MAEGGGRALRGGAGGAVVSFGDDDLLGLTAGGWAAGGGRFRIADAVAIGAEAQVWIGAGIFGRGLGVEPIGHLTVQFGVELAL